MDMQTLITSKFQTTIPKKIREQLHLSIHDTLEWHIEDGKISVSPVSADFLSHQNSIHVGPGKISDDIALARQRRAEKYS